MYYIFCVILLGILIFVLVRKIQRQQHKFQLDYRYTQKDFPIVVYYDYSPNRRSNLSNEHESIQAAINDISNKTNFTFFTLLPPGDRPKDKESVLFIKDGIYEHECPFGVLAHAYFPPMKEICIDASET